MSLALDTIRDGLPQTLPAAATVLPSYPGTPGNHSESGTSADMKVTKTFLSKTMHVLLSARVPGNEACYTCSSNEGTFLCHTLCCPVAMGPGSTNRLPPSEPSPETAKQNLCH